MEFYDPSVLREIGRAICPVLKVDVNTTMESRGTYANMCAY